MKSDNPFQFIPWALLLFISISCSAPRNNKGPILYSKYVGDSFELYIDLPEGYTADRNYSIVFYMDANLNLGDEVRRQIRLASNREKLKQVIFVGVGHIGDYREQRRRDFIPPVVKDGRSAKSDDVDFGHADHFYNFLSHELIPYVNKEYPNNGRYTYIGHSLSGLFGFYCLLKAERLFVNHVALSPSLWINYNNAFEIEEAFFNDHETLNSTLYHACGTGEWMNKVLSTSRRMKVVFNIRDYKGFKYTYTEHKGKSHNEVVPVSLEYVLREMEF